MAITLNNCVDADKQSYNKFILPRLLPFSVNRGLPFITTFLLTAVLAHKSIGDLAVFSYILSMFMVITTLLTMPLVITGNFAAKSNDSSELSSIFTSGLLLSILLSLTSVSVNVFFYNYFFISSVFYEINKNVDLSASLYLIATFLLGINTFLFTFLESKDCQDKVAKSKLLSSLLSTIYIVMTSFVYNVDALMVAFSSFLVMEVSTSLLLLFIAINYSNSLKIGLFSFEKSRVSIKLTKKILSVGIPIAIGLTVQKLIFFLLNERLSSINDSYVAILSIFGTITTLLLIPIVSHSQANSLFISKYPSFKNNIVSSIKLLLVVVSSVLFFGYITSTYIAIIFNIKSIDSGLTEGLVPAIFFSIVVRSFLAYTTSSLRGVSDTLVPQIVISFILAVIFIPIIFTSYFDNASFEFVINLQSLFIFICSLILFFRLFYKFKV